MVFQTKYIFSRNELDNLYLKQNFSLSQIGKKFGCNGVTILRALQKFGIKRRGAYFKKVEISKETLYDLYWNKKLSSTQIGKIYNINNRTVCKKLNKLNIVRRTMSEARTRKRKISFSENL